MNRPLISVVIVNWNGRKWLKKCLDSLFSQTYKDIEVVVVDNYSSDDSVVFIKKEYPKVTLVENKQNIGFAGGNNIGVEKASGELILLLNNDAWLDEVFVEKLLNFFVISQLDVVAPVEYGYEKQRPLYSCIRTDLLGHPVHITRDNSEGFYLSGVCLLFPKRLYTESGGLDGDFFMYFEETDWFWRLNLLKKRFGRCRGISVYHAGAGSTGSGIKYKSFLWRNQNTLQMLLKNYAWYNLLWVLPIYFIQNIFEIIAFLVFLKPKIAWSYVEGWWFNLKNLKRTLKKRKWVQQNRIVGDWEIMKKMYFGFGKAYHLLRFLKAEKI